MKNPDLLLIDEKHVTSDAILDDFCFDNVKQAVFSGSEELFDFFCEVVKHPSRDIDTVTERRRILEDFITYPSLAEEIATLCEEARKCRIQVSAFNGVPLTDRLDAWIKLTIQLISELEELDRLFMRKVFKSKTLSGIHREPYEKIEDNLNAVRNFLSTDCMRLKVEFSSGFKLKSAMLISTDLIETSPRTSAKKDSSTEDNVIYFGGISMTQYIMGDIHKTALSNLCSTVSQLNTQIQNLFKELKKSVSFYIAALKIMKYLENNGMKYCFPEFTDVKSFGISSKGLYDLSLTAFNKAKNITGNDFECEDGNIIVITGLNQGGKTTFLRSIGVAQIFAQAGLFVPAEEYKCSCFSGILTHFPKEEDSNMDFGKLAEELTRLRNDFPVVLGGGLALFNESFATTTAREGAEIAADMLRAFSETGSTVFFVTHLYELATKLNELNNKLPEGCKAVSMVTQLNTDNTEERTYKIVRGEPLEDIYASGFIF